MSEERKTFTLSQVLSPMQQKQVERIMRSTHDSIERTKRLKDYYGTFRDDLERQGLLPEYLAYATEYAYIQSNAQRAARKGR